MIWLLLILVGCVAVGTQFMRILSPTMRRAACVLALALLVYVLFLMPANGPHDPTALFMALPLAAIFLGAIAAEVIEFIGQRWRVSINGR